MPAIDPNFMSLPVVGTHNFETVSNPTPHEVRAEDKANNMLGIHGKLVAVDFDICIADGICLSVCPTNVFEWLDTPGCTSPNNSGQALLAEKKADPAREPDCIFCRACEIQCPVLAIKITEQ